MYLVTRSRTGESLQRSQTADDEPDVTTLEELGPDREY